MYQIKLIESASDAIIQKAIEMDHAAFPVSDWIIREDAYLIYRSKSICLIWLTESDTPLGLLTILPLGSGVPDRAVKSKFFKKTVFFSGSTRYICI